MIVKINTHPIVKEVHEEYHMNWCGRLIDTNPKIENGLPVFVIVGSQSRMELNTIDMARIESAAKRMTYPRGKAAVTTDKAYVYIKEADGKETLIGVLTHNHVKTYNQMYDEFEFG